MLGGPKKGSFFFSQGLRIHIDIVIHIVSLIKHFRYPDRSLQTHSLYESIEERGVLSRRKGTLTSTQAQLFYTWSNTAHAAPRRHKVVCHLYSGLFSFKVCRRVNCYKQQLSLTVQLSTRILLGRKTGGLGGSNPVRIYLKKTINFKAI